VRERQDNIINYDTASIRLLFKARKSGAPVCCLERECSRGYHGLMKDYGELLRRFRSYLYIGGLVFVGAYYAIRLIR
jgi:hypothetical protein